MSGIEHIQLVNFSTNLQYRLKLLAQTRVHTDRLLATRYNVFDYIEPDENRLSDIIADLLDANGRHGQSSAFLRLVFARIKGKTLPIGPSAIFRENVTSRIDSHLRRVDILVDFAQFGLAIENKPWAGDQEDQISDYVAHLERRFAGQFVILYLAPDGRKPTSLDQSQCDRLLKEEKLLLWAYPGPLRGWLRDCYKECEAEPVRIFLQNFIQYIDGAFRITKEEENGD